MSEAHRRGHCFRIQGRALHRRVPSGRDGPAWAGQARPSSARRTAPRCGQLPESVRPVLSSVRPFLQRRAGSKYSPTDTSTNFDCMQKARPEPWERGANKIKQLRPPRAAVAEGRLSPGRGRQARGCSTVTGRRREGVLGVLVQGNLNLIVRRCWVGPVGRQCPQ